MLSGSGILVVRQYIEAGQHDWGAGAVRREAAVLTALERRGLPVPRVVHADPEGIGMGAPTLVMTLVPGRVHLTPNDPEPWLWQMGGNAASHSQSGYPCSAVRTVVRRSTDKFSSWITRSRGLGPRNRFRFNGASRLRIALHSSRLPALQSSLDRRTIDWSRGLVRSSHGPPDADVAHCRLNLAVLFSASIAERFRLAYEAEAGRVVDPWWDVAALMSYSQDWKRFIPLQVANRTTVDIDGMDARMDELLTLAVGRAK